MKRFLLFVGALCCSAAAMAQNPGIDNAAGMVWQAELRSAFAPERHNIDMRGIDLELAFGYRFDPRFSLYVPFAGTVGLFESDGVKSYDETIQLGLGFGYAPLHTDRDRLEIAANAGSTLGGSWRYSYYDCGLRWQFSTACSPFYLGAGVRYFDCFGGGLPDYCAFYVSLGVRFMLH